jgi:hypothetical protein
LYKDSSKPDYLALNWETKHDQLWSEIKSDSGLGEYYPTQMFTESLITTFENEWDVLPEGRNKAIHGNGAICPFTVDVSNGKIYSVIVNKSITLASVIPPGHTDLDGPIVSKKLQLHQNGLQLIRKRLEFIIRYSPCPLLSTF